MHREFRLRSKYAGCPVGLHLTSYRHALAGMSTAQRQPLSKGCRYESASNHSTFLNGSATAALSNCVCAKWRSDIYRNF
jgi:hypothetical protein